eukprot:358642-Chlamydomonas_euryale.AAC.1
MAPRARVNAPAPPISTHLLHGSACLRRDPRAFPHAVPTSSLNLPDQPLPHSTPLPLHPAPPKSGPAHAYRLTHTSPFPTHPGSPQIPCFPQASSLLHPC